MQFHKCSICGKIVAMVKDGFGDVVCCDVPTVKRLMLTEAKRRGYDADKLIWVEQ